MKKFFLITLCVIFVAGCATKQKTASLEGMPTGAPVEKVQITGDKCEWNPNVIRVKQGTHVVLAVKSVDWDYNFHLNGFDLSFMVKKGDMVTGEIYASEKGEFEFGCYIQEGLNYTWGGMVGKLIVE